MQHPSLDSVAQGIEGRPTAVTLRFPPRA